MARLSPALGPAETAVDVLPQHREGTRRASSVTSPLSAQGVERPERENAKVGPVGIGVQRTAPVTIPTNPGGGHRENAERAHSGGHAG